MIMLLMAANMMAERLSGHVTNSTNREAMAYVTISLMTEDSVLLDGAITDDKGDYSLADVGAGNYILSASYVGYTTVYRKINISNGNQTADFALKEETEQLTEVEIKAKKPLIERQMDKLVMNVSASPFSIGSNGQDVLKRAPGVRIDQDGNITVNGKSVEVYIDGRPSYMTGEQLKGLLQGTAGASIEKIEIITNPSSKYDAAGQGGIINIKLKKNMMKGFNGMLAANYGGMYFKQPDKYLQQDYATLNLNYRGPKTYTSLALTQVYANQGVEFSSYSQQPTVTDTMRLGSDLRYDIQFQYYDVRASHDWYIDEKNTLGAILNVPIMKFATDAKTVGEYGTYTQLGEEIVNKSFTDGGQDNYSPQHSANLNYTHVFADSCSQELTVNIDYNRYNSHSLNYQRNRDVVTLPGYESLPALDIASKQLVDIYSARLDFQTAFCQKGFIESGAKYAMSLQSNEMQTDSTLSDGAHSTTEREISYHEEIAALYFTASWQFNEKWSLKGGIRGEYTYNTYLSRFDLFPTAFVGYNPAPDWRLSASYTRRIKRPNYWQFSPFREYVNAHTYQEGYPGLQPEFNNQLDLSFGWNQYISLAANFAHTENMMHTKVDVMPNGDLRSKWTNFGTCTTHGVSLSLTEVPIVPRKNEEGKVNGAWLALTFNAGYYNFISRAYEGDYLQRSHYANCNGSLTAYLPKDYQLAVDGWYSAPMTIGYQYTRATGAMGFAFKKVFPKQQLSLSLNVNDLLRSTKSWQEDRGLAEGYASHVSQEVHQQSINIGLTYMFGKQQWHKRRNVGQTDEASRLGGGAGVGSK